MTNDQADVLRQLVRESAEADTSVPVARPGLIVVAGGQSGVGTTTIAVNLAAVLAGRGKKVVLVDADCDGGGVALQCGLDDHYSHTVADVLSGRRTVGEVLQPGPASVRVLPGVWGLEKLTDYPAAAGGRLLSQLATLGSHTDLVVMDVGHSPHGLAPSFWRAADFVLAVTTPQPEAIMDTYASIKSHGSEIRASVGAVVNRVPTSEEAASVHARLARVCHRFLGLKLGRLGSIGSDPQVAAAGPAGKPVVLAAAESLAARQFGELADAVSADERLAAWSAPLPSSASPSADRLTA